MFDADKFVRGLTVIIMQGTFWGMLAAFAVRGVIRWTMTNFQIKRHD